MQNDLLIQRQVLAQLQHTGVAAGSIGVEVHHGVVKLAGCASDAATKKNIEITALGVEGVSTVIMEIDVLGVSAVAPDLRNMPVVESA